MNRTAIISLFLAVTTSSLALAQSSDMKDMETQKCTSMKETKGGDMPGMDMKDMDAQKCKEMMTNKTVAVVKKVDVANGKVTLAHESIKNLNWPAMTMAFSVKDKMLFDKLAVGKKVNVEFDKEGADYVVTAVR